MRYEQFLEGGIDMKKLLLMVTAISFLSLAQGVAFAQKKPFEGQALRVATFGGVFGKAYHEIFGVPFENETGAKIEYAYANPATHLAKLIASRGQEPPFDVIALDSMSQSDAIRQGLIEKWTESDIPNAKKVFSAARFSPDYTPGQWFVFYGLAYNTQKFKELGIPEPESWDILWHPKLAKRVALPDIDIMSAYFLIVGSAVMAGGDEKNISPGLNKLKEIDLQYIFRSSADVETRISLGDVWLSLLPDGRAFTMADSGFPMGFAHPKIRDKKGLFAFSGHHVVKGAKNKKLAAMFVNKGFEVDAQAELAKKMNYAPTLIEAAELVRKDPKYAKIFLILNPKDMENVYIWDWDLLSRSRAEWVDKWSRTFKR